MKSIWINLDQSPEDETVAAINHTLKLNTKCLNKKSKLKCTQRKNDYKQLLRRKPRGYGVRIKPFKGMRVDKKGKILIPKGH